MKHLTLRATLAFLLTLACLSPLGAAMGGGGHPDQPAAVDVTLQNKCTRDVKYSIKEGAASKTGTIAKGDKLKISLAVGAEVCIDGDHLLTLAGADAGKTLVVCQ